MATTSDSCVAFAMVLFKRIAIIGGGPAGLAAAKALALEPASFSIDLFERRDNIGGLWYYGGDKTKVSPRIPSIDPDDKEILDPNNGFQNRFFSPMYDQLETNLVTRLMKYNKVRDSIFTPETKMYTRRENVLEYIHRYKDTIPSGVNFHFNRNITRLLKEKDEWLLEVEDSTSLDRETRTFDAVILANGHFEIPYIPDTPGIAEWAKADPKTVTHAKYFTDGAPFRDKNVVVVGGLSSGTDLATQISTVAKSVHVSIKGDPKDYELIREDLQVVPLITEYSHKTKLAKTADGQVLEDIDSIVFCTGYLYSYPFLKQYLEVTDGLQVKDIYAQIFNVDDPSLTFIALPKDVIPMPLSELQAAVVARVFSGRLKLACREERRAAYEKELKEKGSGKSFHSFKTPEDVEYYTKLYNWVNDAGLLDEGLAPSQWGEQRKIDRKNTKADKEVRIAMMLEHAAKLRKKHLVFKLPDEEYIL